MNKESRLSTAQISVIIIGIAIIVFAVILAVEDNNVSRNFDAMSAQIEELSEDVNREEGSCRTVTKTYAGVLESAVTQSDGNELDHYIVIGSSYISVSEQEYLKAKDNIGKFVTVETESMEAKDIDGDYHSTYSAVVTYEDEE